MGALLNGKHGHSHKRNGKHGHSHKRLRNGKHGHSHKLLYSGLFHSHKLLCNGKHGHSPKLQCNLDKNRLGRNDLNSTSPHTAGRIPSPALAPTWVPTGHRAFEALEANLETHREASNSSRLGVV